MHSGHADQGTADSDHGWSVRYTTTLGALELDVDIEAAESVVCLIGPNGSGKTSLLRAIAGASRPARGRIRIGPRVVWSPEGRIDLAPEERRVGYVPQGYGLFPHLDALSNVAFGIRADDSRSRRRRAGEMLAEMNAGALGSRSPRRLSGGEKQRVALARALAADPALLLLDEPLAALDATARGAVRAFLAERLDRLGSPALVVTHDARDVRALADRVIVLEAGRVVQSGAPDAVASEPSTPFVEEFFG